jgi:TonB family protein
VARLHRRARTTAKFAERLSNGQNGRGMAPCKQLIVIAAALTAAGCTSPVAERREPPAPRGTAAPAAPAAPRADAEAPVRAATLDGFKKQMARRISDSSTEVSPDPLPPMLKSIVVLDITIDREGRPQRVAVRRSNGYRLLERKAMESVWRAAPFVPPGPAVLRGASSVSFLETFLFSDDDRFRIRSLVE